MTRSILLINSVGQILLPNLIEFLASISEYSVDNGRGSVYVPSKYEGHSNQDITDLPIESASDPVVYLLVATIIRTNRGGTQAKLDFGLGSMIDAFRNNHQLAHPFFPRLTLVQRWKDEKFFSNRVDVFYDTRENLNTKIAWKMGTSAAGAFGIPRKSCKCLGGASLFYSTDDGTGDIASDASKNADYNSGNREQRSQEDSIEKEKRVRTKRDRSRVSLQYHCYVPREKDKRENGNTRDIRIGVARLSSRYFGPVLRQQPPFFDGLFQWPKQPNTSPTQDVVRWCLPHGRVSSTDIECTKRLSNEQERLSLNIADSRRAVFIAAARWMKAIAWKYWTVVIAAIKLDRNTRQKSVLDRFQKVH
ncbi:hypothetical protein V1478_015932 [Vespula squamosa]|uniref:Uncharacterized protein n=1 Tax=Vespula squamosa TaxID=30214 RepID=A0ABD2A2N5_VESSQ